MSFFPNIFIVCKTIWFQTKESDDLLLAHKTVQAVWSQENEMIHRPSYTLALILQYWKSWSYFHPILLENRSDFKRVESVLCLVNYIFKHWYDVFDHRTFYQPVYCCILYGIHHWKKFPVSHWKISVSICEILEDNTKRILHIWIKHH
jgi:hypothetical protein